MHDLTWDRPPSTKTQTISPCVTQATTTEMARIQTSASIVTTIEVLVRRAQALVMNTQPPPPVFKHRLPVAPKLCALEPIGVEMSDLEGAGFLATRVLPGVIGHSILRTSVKPRCIPLR